MLERGKGGRERGTARGCAWWAENGHLGVRVTRLPPDSRAFCHVTLEKPLVLIRCFLTITRLHLPLWLECLFLPFRLAHLSGVGLDLSSSRKHPHVPQSWFRGPPLSPSKEFWLHWPACARLNYTLSVFITKAKSRSRPRPNAQPRGAPQVPAEQMWREGGGVWTL